MSKEGKLVFENRLKNKLAEKFNQYQGEVILYAVQNCLMGLNIEIGDVEEHTSDELIKLYINALEIQGRSSKTLQRYEYQIRHMVNHVNVPIQDISIYNLRSYLGYQKEQGLQDSTLEGTRQVFSAFFNWLHREGLILHNPVANLGAIKRAKKIKTTYSDIDIEKLKQKCKCLRDKAIICFLQSTGCRISEMTQLNREHINLQTGECKVLGKGNKERMIYFDAVTSMAIEEYLENREDNGEPLFVSNRSPYRRLEPNGVRAMFKHLQQETGIEHVHPHKFRRTRATKLVKHGMPIQEVAAILGHEKLDTTMKYVILDQEDIKTSYNRYL